MKHKYIVFISCILSQSTPVWGRIGEKERRNHTTGKGRRAHFQGTKY